MDRMELRKLFENYGIVEDVDIKRHMPVAGLDAAATQTYSFVKYEDMNMSQKAKRHLNGKIVGRSEIKIGYGKSNQFNKIENLF